MNIIALGVDMAARSFVAALWFDQQRQIKASFLNDPRGFRQLDRWLQTHGVAAVRAGLECTNTYGQALAHWLHAKGHQVYLLNPERTACYARARGQQNKTDPADAVTIAAYVALHALTPWAPPLPAQEQLRALTRTRQQLVQQGVQLRCQLKTAHPATRPFLQATLKAVLHQIDRIKTALTEQLRHHPDLDEQVRRLMTVKGVGWLTATITLAELPPIHPQTDPRAICAWAGLIPRRWQSGKTELPARLSRKGNAYLRQALFMPALVARRSNPLLRAFADHLRAKGKRPGAIIGAVAHKLLRILVALLKSKTDFDPNWSSGHP